LTLAPTTARRILSNFWTVSTVRRRESSPKLPNTKNQGWSTASTISPNYQVGRSPVIFWAFARYFLGSYSLQTI